MRCTTRMAHSLALVAVCLYVLVPTVGAQDCPELVGHLEMPDGPLHAAAAGGYVYTTDCENNEGGSFHVIDVSTPSDPVEVGSLEICARDVVVSGDYAYVDRRHTDPYYGFMGVQVIDVSDPTSPFGVDLIMGRGHIAAVADGYAYTVDDEAGIWIIDVSDPRSPTEVGFLAAPRYREFRSLRVSGHLAYATSTTLEGYPNSPRQFLDVIDVSDPSAPFVVGSTQVARDYIPDWASWRVNGSSSDVAVSGAYAFISTSIRLCESPIVWSCREYGGMTVVDVRDPSAPAVVAYMEIGPPKGLVVSGRLLFVSFESDTAFLRVIDIHDPSNPTLFGPPYHVPFPLDDCDWIEPGAICYCARYLYTTGGVWDRATGSYSSGLQVFDTWSRGCRHLWTQPMPLELE